MSFLVLNDLWIVQNLLVPLRAVLPALGRLRREEQEFEAGAEEMVHMKKTHGEPEFGSPVSM